MRKLLVVLLAIILGTSCYAINPFETANDKFGQDKVFHYFGGIIIDDILENVCNMPFGDALLLEQFIGVTKECLDVVLGGSFDLGDFIAMNAGIATRRMAINSVGKWDYKNRVKEGLPVAYPNKYGIDTAQL